MKLSILLLLAGDVSLNPGPVSSGASKVKMGTLNVRSIRLKSASLTDLIISKSIDILSLTETWLEPAETESCLADLTPPGYIFKHTPRISKKKGGGVGFMVTNQMNVDELNIPSF